MPALTLGQISSLVTGFNQGRTDYSLSDLSMYANVALEELANQSEMRGLEVTVTCPVGQSQNNTGTTGYDLVITPAYPDNGFYPNFIYTVFNNEQPPGSPERILQPTTQDWILSQSTTSGIPRYYAWFQEQLTVWPSAKSSALQLLVRYSAKPMPMVASTSTPGVDPKWHYAIACRAAAIAAAARNDIEQEAINQARYLNVVNSLYPDRAVRQLGARQSLSLGWHR